MFVTYCLVCMNEEKTLNNIICQYTCRRAEWSFLNAQKKNTPKLPRKRIFPFTGTRLLYSIPYRMVAFDFFHRNVQFAKRRSISWIFLPAFQHDPVSDSQKKKKKKKNHNISGKKIV